MSKLSSLLNPAPNPDTHAPALQTQQLAIDGQHDSHSNEVAGGLAHTGSGSPHRLSIAASPLEALAAAATSSAPMLSPSNPNGAPSITPGAHQQTFHHPLSRPTSSHTSPPPHFDFARTADPPAPRFSPGLEQYHHSTSSEVRARRMSGITDNAPAILAPLRGSLPKESRQSPVPLPALRSHSEVSDGAVRGTSAQPDHQTSTSKETEPGHLNNAPVLTQIRQPLPGPALPSVVTALPETQHDQVKVKAEITEDTPQLPHKIRLSDSQSVSMQGVTSAEHLHRKEVQAVSKDVGDLKNDGSYRPSPNTTGELNRSTSATPKPAPTKKRAAPKKGTASAVKPAAKKRKIDAESVDGTPSVKRSATPASSRASKTPAPKNRKQDSATPTRSSSVAQQEDDEDMDDDSQLFCICRKPDDHTWMIGCDGSCEDWFHGRCVKMTEEDGKIIDKWICRRNVSTSCDNC